METQIEYIFTGAIWSDGEDYMILNVDGKFYGRGDSFDFECESAEEMIRTLKKWGYKYIGVN